MCTSRDEGVGLAAPQVGVNVRLMVFNPEGKRGEGEELVLCNPRIISSSKGLGWHEEGCLSFRRLQDDDLIKADVEVDLHDRSRLSLFFHSMTCMTIIDKIWLGPQ